MANYSKVGTGSKQIENLGIIKKSDMQIDVIGGTIQYAYGSDVQLIGTEIRTAQTNQSITAISEDGGFYRITIADASNLRLNEGLPVEDSAGNLKDAVVINEINGNVITVNKRGELVVGDVLIIPADPILQEGAILEVPARSYPYFIYVAESTDVKINFNTNLKKK